MTLHERYRVVHHAVAARMEADRSIVYFLAAPGEGMLVLRHAADDQTMARNYLG